MLLSKPTGEISPPASALSAAERTPLPFQIVRDRARNGHTPHAGPVPKAIFILDRDSLNVVYGPEEQETLRGLVDLYALPQTRESIRANLSLLAEAEILFTSWGAPRLDEELLSCAPNLKAVFHAAGSIRSFTTPAFWQRGITVTCAAAANAEPVCEYTIGSILLGLSAGSGGPLRTRAGARVGATIPVGSPVDTAAPWGWSRAGTIARKVAARLASYDVKRLVYDPFRQRRRKPQP